MLVPRDPPDPRMWGTAHWKTDEVPSSQQCLRKLLPTLASEVPNQEVFRGRDLISVVRNEFRLNRDLQGEAADMRVDDGFTALRELASQQSVAACTSITRTEVSGSVGG